MPTPKPTQDQPTPSEGSLFPATPWTQLIRLRGTGETADKALADVCQMYWYPVYGFIRSQGKAPQDAEDLTQDFFLRLLERRDLEGLVPERGRLRQFLLTAVKNFLRTAWRDQNRLKRGGGKEIVSLDVEWAEGRLRLEASSELDPERCFEQRWAVTLLENVLTELEKKYLQTGRGAQFEVLSGFLSWRAEAPTYAVAAAKLDMDEGAVRVAVHRLRKRYRGLLEKHISATVDSAAEVDEELDHLMTVFST